MAERRENSVLFSLRELRNIEEERVKSEEDAERARIEAERRAREEEIRRQREAEEAKVRAEQDRIRKEQEERERIRVDAEMKLKEAERRAQIEAHTRLEAARIEAEARARAEAKKFPVGAVVGGVIALVVVAGGIMGYLVHNHNVELARQQQELKAKADADKKRLEAEAAAQAAKLKKDLEDLQGQLEHATDEAEKAKLRAAIEQRTRSSSSGHASASRGDKPAAAAKPKGPKVSNSDDPLGGLGL